MARITGGMYSSNEKDLHWNCLSGN